MQRNDEKRIRALEEWALKKMKMISFHKVDKT